ncbi:MAG: dUTP diphosphatase [Thermicanus sp.]|nr:dUTP diphosphatase [Thermicanus sp.]
MSVEKMGKLQVRVKRVNDKVGRTIPAPFYATPGSAGLDLAACLDEPVILEPGRRAKIPTGIAIQIPHPGIVGLLFPRSGNALKHGISLTNAVGVIDSDYTGEIQVILQNLDPTDPFIIHPGDRIAQLLFLPIMQAELLFTDRLEETERQSGGFGSTGR